MSYVSSLPAPGVNNPPPHRLNRRQIHSLTRQTTTAVKAKLRRPVSVCPSVQTRKSCSKPKALPALLQLSHEHQHHQGGCNRSPSSINPLWGGGIKPGGTLNHAAAIEDVTCPLPNTRVLRRRCVRVYVHLREILEVFQDCGRSPEN